MSDIEAGNLNDPNSFTPTEDQKVLRIIKGLQPIETLLDELRVILNKYEIKEGFKTILIVEQEDGDVFTAHAPRITKSHKHWLLTLAFNNFWEEIYNPDDYEGNDNNQAS